MRGETGNGLAEEQQVEGHSEQGFAEGIGLAFDQKTGTEQPAKGKKIVFFDNLQDFEGVDQGGWFLATVIERVTKIWPGKWLPAGSARWTMHQFGSRRTLDSN